MKVLTWLKSKFSGTTEPEIDSVVVQERPAPPRRKPRKKRKATRPAMPAPEGFIWQSRDGYRGARRKLELLCATCLEPSPVKPQFTLVNGKPVMKPYEYVCEHKETA